MRPVAIRRRMFEVAKSTEVRGKDTVALSKARFESQRARADLQGE